MLNEQYLRSVVMMQAIRQADIVLRVQTKVLQLELLLLRDTAGKILLQRDV